MTSIRVFLVTARRCRRTLPQVGVSVLLAALSAVSIAFYLHAWGSFTELQQLSPDQLVRALAGIC